MYSVSVGQRAEVQRAEYSPNQKDFLDSVTPNTSKKVMKPDFEFGARRKNYLDSAEVKFQKFSYSARKRLKFKLVSTAA